MAETVTLGRQSIAELIHGQVQTPVLIYDLGRVGTLAKVARCVRERSGARVLYSVKACAFSDVLQTLGPSLDGFAVSSLFEARLVRGLYPDSPVHLTTPGLREDEIGKLIEICDFVTFNSETQLHRFGPRVGRHASVGLRVNTGISKVGDPRYDPALRYSKLGVPLKMLPEILASAPVTVNGLHFHTNADSDDLRELETNVEALVYSETGTNRFDWVNFGGGYLFGEAFTLQPLERAVALAKHELADEVFVEPGAGLVRTAGYLVASVIDIFERHGTRIAILDTSVNHLPEVLEFGYQPEVESSTPHGSFEYALAGGSCLAGDAFGRYRFETPLTIGTTVTFREVGAYAQAKSHRFNGIDLPSVWVASSEDTLEQRQSSNYAVYLQHWTPNA